MGIQLTPSLKQLTLDRQHLRVSRWAFALVIVSLLIQLGSLTFIIANTNGSVKEEEDRVVTRASIATSTAILETPRASILVFAGVLHFVMGRSSRWRWAGAGLVLTIVAEFVATGLGLAFMGESYSSKAGMPIALRAAASANQFLSVLEDWWMAVLLGEFALACGDTILLSQSERLGYGVLAALASVMLFVGWTTPVKTLPDDEFTQFLMVAVLATNLLVVVWLVQAIFRALFVSRVLITHLDAQRLLLENADDGKGT